MQYGCEVDRKTEFWSYVRHSVIIIQMHTRNALSQRMKNVKKLGKQAIHMAGVTQLLFGIRGKRWDNDKLYHTFFNKNWCYPSVEETPKGNGQVEGGTYWK